MTTFGWDTSSWDDTPAQRDGIDYFTCKLTDGDHYYENPTFAAKMNAMRGFGVPILGAYHVVWGSRSIANQVAWYIQMLDIRIPWWRTHDYFICQSDSEPFYPGQTAPTVTQINEFHDRIITASGGRIAAAKNEAYAPEWFYDAALSGLRYGWWSSKYGTNPTGPYATIYPGDGDARWGGPLPAFFLQYGSNAIIAGQTTSDANAYRGTLDQLKAVLGGDMTQPEDVAKAVWAQIIGSASLNRTAPAADWLKAGEVSVRLLKDTTFGLQAVQADLDTVKADLDAIKAALAALAGVDHTHTVTVTGAGGTGPAQPLDPAP